MKIKASKLIAILMTMLGWGYVLSGQGELYSLDLAKQWATEKWRGKNYVYFTITAAKWFGKHVADCSGMIICAIRSVIPKYNDQAANELYAACTEKGPISTIPEISGLCVWKDGHIGVYIGGGKVIESRGVAYGVVITDVKDRPWTKWGKLAAVDYSEAVVSMAPTFHVSKVLKRGMDNPQVIPIARNLTALGYSARGETSIFDAALELDVKSFQRAYKLTEDGIVGKQTTTALGGIWDGK